MPNDEMLSFLSYSNKITYEDLMKIDPDYLSKFIKEIADTRRVEVIFYAALGHSNQLTMMCVERAPYLVGKFTEEFVAKNVEFYRQVARKDLVAALDCITNLNDSLMKRFSFELFEGLLLKPTFFRCLSDAFIMSHQEESMKIINKDPNVMRFAPRQLLIKYAEEVMALFRINNKLLEYIPDEVQLAHIEEIRKAVIANPLLFDDLCVKGKDKDLFYNVLNQRIPELNKEQRDLAYSYSLNNEYLLATLKPCMLDARLVSILGEKVVGRLLRYKDVINAIESIYDDENKFILFLEMIKLYADTPYLEPKIGYICDALTKNEIMFVSDEKVESNYLMVNDQRGRGYRDRAPMYETKHVGIGRLDDYIATILAERELTTIERKRVAYLYLKNRGSIFVDNPDDFQNLDTYRIKRLQEKAANKELIVSDAKDILFELKYGMSLAEVEGLLSKYGEELDDLLIEFDRSGLSLEEVELKGALLNLFQMKMLNELSDINVLRDEIENAFVNYKGEESVYDNFLHLEDALKKIYTTKMVKESSRDLQYSETMYCVYEDVVPEDQRNPKYIGKRVRICKVDPESEYQIFVSVNEGYRKKKDDSDEPTALERWMNPMYNGNHAISTSMIGTSYFGTAPITAYDGSRKRVLRFKVEDGNAIAASAPFAKESNSDKDITVAMKSSMYLSSKRNLEYTRHTRNETFVENDELDDESYSKRMPSSIICFEVIDVNALEAAIEFGVDIEIIDRKKTARFVRQRIHDNFLKFEQYVLNDQRQYRSCFTKLLSDFASMRAGFKDSDIKNIMVDDADALFNSSALNKYFEKLFEDLDTLIDNGDLERIGGIINTIRSAIELEERKISLIDYDGRKKYRIPYDKKTVMRELDRIERKSGLKRRSDIITVQTLDNLDKDLSIASRHFQTRWTCYVLPEQLEYANLKDKIDINFIRNNIDSVYRSGLYTGFASHDVSHIERTSVYVSILANLLGLSKEDAELAILAAIYHDSGRITEGEEKHGDYSASIARSMLSDALSKEDVNIVCAAIDLHDEKRESEPELSKMMIKYRIKDRDRLTMIYKILKDADALDRTRFLGSAALEIYYLRFPETKTLIKFATQLNEIEALRKIEILLNKHIVSSQQVYKELSSNRLPQEIVHTFARMYKIPINSPIFEEIPTFTGVSMGLK